MGHRAAGAIAAAVALLVTGGACSLRDDPPASDPTPAALLATPIDPGTPIPLPEATAAGPPAPVPAPSSAPPPDRAPVGPGTSDTQSTGAPGYETTVSEITPELAERMSASWRPGCPVPLEDLRYLTLTHHGFDGGVVEGELVVHADVADDVVGVFGVLFDEGFPIRSMRLVDDFGGSDDASMAADNTSAFNCRVVAGTGTWSEHAYGRAIDINPVENPWVRGGDVQPPAGADFAARPDAPGVIHADDAVVRAFAEIGWTWGGTWSSPVDYQHFSLTGR